jgi:hypothetical protein
MKKILQLVGLCCFGVASVFSDVCGMKATGGQQCGSPNSGVMQAVSSGSGQENTDVFGSLSVLEGKIRSFCEEKGLTVSDCRLVLEPSLKLVNVIFKYGENFVDGPGFKEYTKYLSDPRGLFIFSYVFHPDESFRFPSPKEKFTNKTMNNLLIDLVEKYGDSMRFVDKINFYMEKPLPL